MIHFGKGFRQIQERVLVLAECEAPIRRLKVLLLMTFGVRKFSIRPAIEGYIGAPQKLQAITALKNFLKCT